MSKSTAVDIEDEIVPTCRELGIGLVPYSPLGRGMLTGTISSLDQLGDDDFRRMVPRWQGDNLDANLALVEVVRSIAAAKGVTPGQVALAWVLLVTLALTVAAAVLLHRNLFPAFVAFAATSPPEQLALLSPDHVFQASSVLAAPSPASR